MARTAEEREPQTPVADAVLANPLAIPAGVAVWLRGWERRLRAAMREVETRTAARGNAVPAFDEAMAELRELHPDERSGVFRLLLQRPLWQLESGGAPRETFERYAETVLGRVAAAVELLREIEPLRAQRERLIGDFAARFPNRLGEQLARARARDEDIARLRRAVDAKRMRARLDRARTTLEQVAATARDAGFDDTHGQVSAGEVETLEELVVALLIERRSRRQLEQHSGALGQQRARLAAELGGLAASALQAGFDASRGRGRAGHTSVILEQLLAAATGAEDSSLSGRDAPLWSGALAAVSSAHHPEPDRFAWLPAMLGVASPGGETRRDAPGQVHLLHVVPIGEDLLYLSPRAESAIRVWTRSVSIGASVDCQVSPDMIGLHPHALVDRDVSAVFTGLDAGRSHWYSTSARAVARVVASHGTGWFARLERKGSVEVMDQPPWHAEAGGSAFRILRPFEATPGATATPVSAVLAGDRVHASFLGFTLREARTGLLGNERAWTRGVTSLWPGSIERVRAEQALFARLERHRSGHSTAHCGLALHPLGWALLGDTQTAMPLYHIPLASLDAPARLRLWIVEREEHLLAALTAVARVIVAVHACGHAIGVCHTEAFAFGIDWAPRPLWPVPTAMLAHAPCATPLGEAYASPASGEMMPSRYTMLRTPVLVPQVAGEQVASAERDMQGFGAFLVDLLLDRPIVNRGALDWYDATRVVREGAVGRTAYPELVGRLIGQIEDPPGWRRLLVLCERLASGEVRRIADLG